MKNGPGTVTFWWKVSSEANYDWLSFYADGVLQDRISGEVGWEQITYTYDPSGRRIAKDVDGVVTKYGAACPELAERDGDQCIAEYDANDVLLRKYIYGPGIDEPRSASLRAGSFCMIEAAGGYAGTYFYHFDALGSVVALSDAAGDTVQVYEYDVYGQVAASDPNHPNRFLFTGREFDKETGLYYYRARYYNASIGRFLQTDPIGYADGMNAYQYCANNAVNRIDPDGLIWEASGRTMVTVAMFAPSTRQQDWWPPATLIGAMIDIATLLSLDEAGQPFIATGILSTLQAIQNTLSINFAWKSYIEVVDYDDVNGDGVIDEGDLDPDDPDQTLEDLILEKKWVEVVGVLSYYDQDRGAFYVEGAGYSDYVAALNGADIAMDYYPYAVPDEYMDRAVPVDAYGGEFALISEWIRQHLAWFDSDLLIQLEALLLPALTGG